MDTSETYKKMSDCAEIQGDSVYPTFAFRTKIFYVGNDVYWQQCYPEYHGAQSGKVKIVQLRRQDQLQEIILENKYCDYSRRSPAGRAALFSEFVYEEWFRPTKIDTSYQVTFEQLWLAYVMHEKFGKAWNGEVWVVEKVFQGYQVISDAFVPVNQEEETESSMAKAGREAGKAMAKYWEDRYFNGSKHPDTQSLFGFPEGRKCF